MKRRLQRLAVRFQEQRGQSIILLAGAMVALLVFAGLAVDAGVIYMGSIHLSRSVDAAALAGVVELPEDDTTGPCSGLSFEERTCLADIKAQDFLWANGITSTVDVPPDEFFQSIRESGVIGSYRYRITATHQVDLYFLPLVNFNYVRLRDTAIADYNPWVDIYTDQSGALGVLKTANQAFKGRSEESERGDAFSPTGSDWYPELQGKYIYRIYVPSGYAYDTVRMEILDPDDWDIGDSLNDFPNQVWISTTLGTSAYVGCRDSNEERPDGSPVICNNPDTDPTNPLWFLGLDEDYQQSPNNPIRFTLFYYQLMADGRLERRDIARYTSLSGWTHGNDHGTNMMWVSPGANQAWDYAGTGVPDDTPAGWLLPGEDGNFEVQVRGNDGDFGTAGSEVPDIYRAPPTGDIYIYLEAESQGAHTENAFELWAGPDLTVYPNVPSNVNYRNVYTIINGLEQAHGSGGVVMYAVGHMAFNSNSVNRTEMQLADIPAAWAGRRVRIDAFDIDTETKPPFIFYFDTMPQKDWQVCYDDTAGGCNQSGTRCETTATEECWDIPAYGYRCADFGPDEDLDGVGFDVAGTSYLVNSSCGGQPSNNTWRTYEFILPPEEVFYGGRLKVSYGGGNTDNVTFRMMVESVPRLEQ